MFQTFTGSSRRPRQVNLSGRNPNPFAAVNQGVGQPAGHALASAQQERAARQKEREKLLGARTGQRLWRGHTERKRLRSKWRAEWDYHESFSRDRVMNGGVNSSDSTDKPLLPYETQDEAQTQLSKLLHFVDVRDESDLTRLLWCFQRQGALSERRAGNTTAQTQHWSILYRRAQRTCLLAIEERARNKGSNDSSLLVDLLDILETSWIQVPEPGSRVPSNWFQILGKFEKSHYREIDQNADSLALREAYVKVLIAPLIRLSPHTLEAYELFALDYLTLTDLLGSKGSSGNVVAILAERINCRLLGQAISHLEPSKPLEALKAESRLALLALYIYFHRHAYQYHLEEAYSSGNEFVSAVSILLGPLIDRLDIEHKTILVESKFSHRRLQPQSFGDFIQSQLLSLINQESIGGMLSDKHGNFSGNAQDLAGFALTLLRLFPQRSDDIRMWLYLGSAPANSSQSGSSAIPLFWQATRETSVFHSVMKDPSSTLNFLRTGSELSALSPKAVAAINSSWRTILLFLELYSFVLKLMDDEEFFSGINGQPRSKAALSYNDIKDLSTFLKTLAYQMYTKPSKTSESENSSGQLTSTDRQLFHSFSGSVSLSTASSTSKSNKSDITFLGGVSSMNVEYVKGVITGLLRMLYERDSRRTFLPDGHWLMTSDTHMKGFIRAVVAEEESRHQVMDEEKDDDDKDDDEDEDQSSTFGLVGTARTHRHITEERMQRAQRIASRKRYLEVVAPRLQILQNIPFFIPFETRVQIFREFVRLDQQKRRGGVVDPDQWRMSVMSRAVTEDPREELERHHAKIRRDAVFNDAFHQFYKLGDGLKEPIQITFMDKFGTQEAGIDGGGVTKEFLTSATAEAFGEPDGISMFVENDQRLLYPNPLALDEIRKADAYHLDGKSEAQNIITEYLQRCEFLGRIVGKCLYEGILIDIGFAGFFLLKWALTGGSGSAPQESGYRANINDLRDLDEELYQNLLKLKSYSGDVEQDFSLDFTVTDTVHNPLEPTDKPTILTRDLRPGGSSIPVTNANRLVYISYMARYRLQIQPYAQTRAFLRGLGSIVQPSWLSMFNQTELQTLVGGARASIDVQDLRRNTTYGGVYQIGDDGLEHPSVQLFWVIMSELSEEEKGKVLKFVTSTPRPPLLGFGTLNPLFTIRDAGQDQTRLPSTSTCVNLLKLPMYTDPQTLRAKLLYAVNSGAGFDLS